ncbi:beta-1,4-glucosyltransferase [Deltaproteobacteria bacterium Smac51]|nr:beta-1,4-glucosyltransferase [Deltaproteobacteria bacterium Smac51]
MSTLSVIILTGNESRNITDCVASVRGADEVVVVDDESSDDTVELATRAGAKVIRHKLDNFADQRNFALTQTTGEWVFFLDADERFSPGLMDSIRAHMDNRQGMAGSVVRRNFAFGQRHRFGPLKPDRVTRLFPAGTVYWDGLVHERPVFEINSAHLHGHLEHLTYSTWDQYINKQLRYADLWAREKHAVGKITSPLSAVVRGSLGFFKMFILNMGLLGGPVAWALCSYHSLYTMTKYLKLAELNKRDGR